MLAGALITAAVLAAPGVVQNACNSGQSRSTISALMPSSVSAGNMMAVVVTYDGVNSITSVTDTQGSSYVAAGPIVATLDGNMQVWSARLTSSGSSTVTVNLASSTSSGDFVAVYAHEYSGVGTIANYVSGTGMSGTQGDLGSRSTLSGNSAVVAFAKSLTQTVTSAGAGWVERGKCNNDMSADALFPGSGTYRPVFTFSSSGPWMVLAVELGPLAARLAFTTPARTFQAGICGGAGSLVTVRVEDATGVATGSGPMGRAFTISSTSPGGTFYTDSGCVNAAPGGGFTIPAGATTVDLYYRDTQAGMPSFTLANGGGLTNPTPQQQTVLPGPAQSFAVQGLPGSCPATTPQAFTVTAQDAFGNRATGYTGTVHFTSTDTAATLPADAPFAAADTGQRAFQVTFGTQGSQSLTATDVAMASRNGSATTVVVAAPDGGQLDGGQTDGGQLDGGQTPPRILSVPPPATCDVAYLYTPTVAAQSPVSWTFTPDVGQQVPADLIVDPELGSLSLRPTRPLAGVLRAQNGEGADSQPIRIDVTCDGLHLPVGCSCGQLGEGGLVAAALALLLLSSRRRRKS